MPRNSVACLASLLFVWLAGCGSEVEAAAADSGTEAIRDSYTVYFSNPLAPNAVNYRGGPEEALVEAIRQARVSVDVAVYDLNLWSVRDALIRAAQRGVQVRMVVESDSLAARVEMQQLLEAGIPVVEDRHQETMHNKFIVIDRLEVWTGSLNYTTSGAYRNWNNLLRIRSIELAADYTTEFDEMFIQALFGAESQANTPYPQLQVGEVTVEVFFAPEDGAQARLVDLITAADESVHFLAFSLTADPIAEAMAAAQARGVSVSGVMEGSQVASNIGGDFEYLLANGVDVRLDGQPGQMHHKVLIIDGDVVVTGSYNFSRNAEERNDENLLVIWDPGLAADYQEEFWRLWALAGQ